MRGLLHLEFAAFVRWQSITASDWPYDGLENLRCAMLQVAAPCTVHGIASWFDVLFDGSASQRWLSTSPGLPITHW